jgi:hypothetical protein
MKTILFMDIDGVLLRRRHPGIFDSFELAPGCLEFLGWATARFECRWLSSRCRVGWPDGTRRAFRAAGAPLDNASWTVLDLIEPAAWSVSKTETIDPRSDFWWLGDRPSDDDRAWLRLHGCEERLVEVSSDPGALLHARSLLSGLWDRSGRE